MNLEYVASGCSYTRALMISNLYWLVDEVITDLNKRKPNHQMSMLFNAYTEKTFGEKMKNFTGLSEVHADSGGLQIMTLGKENTPEIRDAVYTKQAKDSTVAMCFDEIFIENTVTGGSARTDVNTKTVITSKVYDDGVKTGHNIKRQIDIMIQENSACRPMMILHGNHFDDFKNYYDGMCSVLTEEYLRELKGVAVSDTCIGNGILEGADMVSMLMRLDLPDYLRKKVHLLGVGSFSRLLPTLMLIKSGYLPADMHLSYDSTSHTSGFIMGRCMDYNRITRKLYNIDINKKDIIGQEKFFTKIWNKYSQYLLKICDKDKFFDLMKKAVQSTAGINVEAVGQTDSDTANFGIFLCAIYQIECFTDFIDDFMAADENEMLLFLQKKHYPLLSLRNVRTVQQYEQWRDFAISNRLESKRIKRDLDVQPTKTLDFLFEACC